MHAGYDVLNLRTGATVPLARRKNALPPRWDGCLERGTYSFSETGLSFIDSMLEGLAVTPPARLFIDEIGSLDLERARFRALFGALIPGCGELYASVRMNRVSEFVKAFGITDYSLTELNVPEAGGERR
jgi:hypothetical protein